MLMGIKNGKDGTEGMDKDQGPTRQEHSFRFIQEDARPLDLKHIAGYLRL